MALGAPQDPVFRVISQQMGSLAPRQADEELASSFPGRAVGPCVVGERELRGEEGQ